MPLVINETLFVAAEAMETDEEDDLLQQALAMSRQENKPQPQETKPQAQPHVDAMEDDDDEELRLAMQMSQQAGQVMFCSQITILVNFRLVFVPDPK